MVEWVINGVINEGWDSRSSTFENAVDFPAGDRAELVLVAAHLVVVVRVLLQPADELQIMRDDHQLELLRGLVEFDQGGQLFCQVVDVLAVQVGSRLVQGKHAGAGGEDLGQGHADDDGGQHLLAHRAAALHLELDHLVCLLVHHDGVLVVLALAGVQVDLGVNLDVVDVVAVVHCFPDVLDDPVDLVHLIVVQAGDGGLHRSAILLDVSVHAFQLLQLCLLH